MAEPTLASSKLNEYFIGEGISFADYQHQMRQIINAARPDITDENRQIVLDANAPYLWFPDNYVENNPKQRATLLIHGLFDSPYTLQDIAQHLKNQGHIVAGVLLPGHGTVPGDLLNIHYREWQKAVAHGIATLKKYSNTIDIVGFSLGGALAIDYALQDKTINSLILLSPALRAQTHLEIVLYTYRILGKFAPRLKWYRKRPQTNFVRYTSLTTNGAFQAYHLIHHMRGQLAKKKLKVPVFLVATESDETLYMPSTLKFFNTLNNKKSRMLFYTHASPQINNRHITVRTNVYAEENILDFSHLATPIAPDNLYLGRNSTYKDFNHYATAYVPQDPIYKGAVNKRNLKRYTMQRLTYNPDFQYMMAQLDDFLRNTMK